jgi:hypothetical protein
VNQMPLFRALARSSPPNASSDRSCTSSRRSQAPTSTGCAANGTDPARSEDPDAALKALALQQAWDEIRAIDPVGYELLFVAAPDHDVNQTCPVSPYEIDQML